ncbi:MAG: type II toxin-antitoxin system PemK/MazF family toxin [Chlorobi bacterium]|nr:type II toxin-antitoxin system PemK/MazF family toxin [Chlorobiota bacterium]
MKKGDIVLLPFPFTDLSGSKNRPAIILIENELDITVSFITTQIKWKESTDIIIQPNELTGLKKESLIRLSKIATIDTDIVLGKLGEVNQATLNHIDENLRILFGL